MTQRKASPETMTRLCEAVDRWIQEKGPIDVQPGWAEETNNFYSALTFYRAETTPPLRSRAEVAEQALEALQRYLIPSEREDSRPLGKIWLELERLAGEPTAPEPAPAAQKPFLTCAGCGLTRDQEPSVAVRWDGRPRCNDCAAAWYRSNPGFANPLTDHDQDTREERPCGCEQAEALKDQLKECRRALKTAQRLTNDLVMALDLRLP